MPALTAPTNETGFSALRAENVDRVVKGLAEPKFVMKQVCLISPSSSWQESYYRESDTELTASTDIARGAAFPHESPLWEKRSAYMKKYGLEVEISHEDAITNNIDVIARSLMRLSRAVVKAVDTNIWDIISESRTVSQIQSYTIDAGKEWNSATRANRNPQDDIGEAIRRLAESNYEADTIIVNPLDYIRLVTNDNVIDSFAPSMNQALVNGNVGRLLGLNVLVSNVVTADYAMVLQSKIAATYRVAEELRTFTKYEEGVKHIIRAWEIGVPFITDPKGVCLISNTRA